MIYASTHGAHRYAAMLLRWNHSEQRTLIELQALTILFCALIFCSF